MFKELIFFINRILFCGLTNLSMDFVEAFDLTDVVSNYFVFVAGIAEIAEVGVVRIEVLTFLRLMA